MRHLMSPLDFTVEELNTLMNLANDIEASGELHEYYVPETGEPVINPGFQNWNLLSINMDAWLNGEHRVMEF